MRDERTLGSRQQRQRLRHGLVQRLCAETAADHREPQRAGARAVAALGRSERGNLVAHRVAGPDHRSRCAERCGETGQHAVGDFSEHAIGEPGDRILLVDCERPVEERSHHAARERHVAAHAEHDVGAVREYRTRALPERDQQLQWQQRHAQQPFAAHARHADPRHGVTLGRDQRRFHAGLRAEPDDVPSLPTQVLGHRQCRKDVAAGAARHDHYGSRGVRREA